MRDLRLTDLDYVEIGALVHIDVHDICGLGEERGKYGNLLTACYIVERLRDGIRFEASYQHTIGSAVPFRKRVPGIVRLTARIEDGPRALAALVHVARDVRDVATNENDSYEDDSRQRASKDTIECEILAINLDDRPWESPDCPHECLFRDTRIEELLYGLMTCDCDADEARHMHEEALSLKPSLGHDAELNSLVHYLCSR